MNDLSSDEEDEDTLLVHEERDHYDAAFEKMREQKLRSRQVKAIEELAAAKKKVEDCRIKLGYAREQVNLIMSSVMSSVNTSTTYNCMQDAITDTAVFHLQVLIWKDKVDKQCVERLKSFTNPSLLIVQVGLHR